MDITEHANGFISVDEFYVQGAQAAIRPRIADANDSRPACTCNFYHVKKLPKGFCPHIEAAMSFLRCKVRLIIQVSYPGDNVDNLPYKGI